MNALIASAMVFALLPAVASADAGPTATYSATESIPVPPVSSYAGSAGGDGWGVALSSTQVFNVFHHQSTLQVACHEQTDASNCWPTESETITDASGDNFATSGQPGMHLDQSTGRLYVFAARTSDATGGVVCIDTTQGAINSNPFCGFTVLTAAGDAPLGGQYSSSRIGAPMQIGSHWYAFNYVDGASQIGAQNALLCFDLSTQAACPGQPFAVGLGTGTASLPSWPAEPPTAAIGNQVIIPINFGGTDELGCFDASTQDACAGSWPVATGISYASVYGAPFPLLDATGTVSGLCLPTGSDPCFTMTGASTSTPSGLPGAIGASDPWNGPALVLGPRIYVPNGVVNGNAGDVQCYDYSTSAECPNFPVSFNNLRYLYTVNPDPQRPTCIWVNSDAGASQQIQNFDAYTGGACGQGPIRVLASALVAPSQTCLPYSYSSLQVTSPPPTSYMSGVVAFEDAGGNPIPGIANESLDNRGSASLTGLNLNTTSGLPEFLITLTGSSGTPTTVDVQLTWTGTYDPSCIEPGTTASQPPLSVQPVQNPTLNPVVTVAPYGGGGTTNAQPPTHQSFISRHQKAILIAERTALLAAVTAARGGSFVVDGASFGFTTLASAFLCTADLATAESLNTAISDPPDSRYKHVLTPPGLRLPRMRASCRGLAHNACSQARKLVASYLQAVSHVASLAEAVAVTANRHNAATTASDRKAERAQQVAEAQYLPKLDAALKARKAAGGALGRWLIRHQLNAKVSAAAIRQARKRYVGLYGVPASSIRQLEQLGIIKSRKDLARLISDELRRSGPARSTTLARIIGG